MNLPETLKQFKNISPDPAYQEKSKRAILATIPHEPISAWRIITRIFETGIAVGLAVFFILVITGQFSNTPYVSPVQFSVINPETLRAEAQAVDIQIQLAQVAYEETTTTPTAALPGTSAAALLKALSTIASSSASTTATTGGTSTSTPTSTPAISIDQALKALSQ